MMNWKGALGAAVALAPVTAAAQDGSRMNGPEIGVGVLDHGVRWIEGVPKRLAFAEGLEEGGTSDVQLVYRSRPVAPRALNPRLTAKLQINTNGRTSFASVGAEWRQHVLRDRLYGQIGIGLTVHDGYVNPVDPFAFPPGSPEFLRRYDIYAKRTAFGSRVLLNPNISLGVRLDRRWAVEAAFEHFSHNNWFGKQNPGIDTVGIRLVRTMGRGR